ncbi:MAG: hypothetical protein GX260_03530 [Tissierellia bacterium]|nr:hypothetical protein [Bacillota bacterium]NLL22833.1 hypothetical protein [Tissierellia bacterium]
MNTQIVFTLKDLLMSLLWIALIVFVVFLIVLLIEFIRTVKLARTMIAARKEEIDHIIQVAPGIVDSVDKITGIAAKGVDGAYQGAMSIVNKFKK